MSAKKKTADDIPVTVVVDTREQRPLDFSALPGVTVERRTLDTGDYSLDGHVREICVERKSADDLVGTMIGGYLSMSRRDWYLGRFNRELLRMGRYATSWLVVDCPRGSVLAHQYTSQASPASVLAFVRSLQVVWGVHVYWAENRGDAAREIVAIFRAYLASLREIRRRENVRDFDAMPPPMPDI